MTKAAEFSWPGQRPGDLSHDFILDYLGADVQVNAAAAAALVAAVEAIECGREAECRRIGNLYDLHLTAEGAVIENIYEEGRKGSASLDDFAAAARAWLTFVGE